MPPVAPLLVVSSGNLALIYLTRFPERLTRTGSTANTRG